MKLFQQYPSIIFFFWCTLLFNTNLSQTIPQRLAELTNTFSSIASRSRHDELATVSEIWSTLCKIISKSSRKSWLFLAKSYQEEWISGRSSWSYYSRWVYIRTPQNSIRIKISRRPRKTSCFCSAWKFSIFIRLDVKRSWQCTA